MEQIVYSFAPAVAHDVALDVEGAMGALSSKLDSTFIENTKTFLSKCVYNTCTLNAPKKEKNLSDSTDFLLRLTPLSYLVLQSTWCHGPLRDLKSTRAILQLSATSLASIAA